MRPRQLWLVVLLFSGLSFVGYIARAVVGARQGVRLAGWIGGLVSSTSVTLTYARLSRIAGADVFGLAAGTVGACTVLFPRVIMATAVLHPPLVPPLLGLLAVPLVTGVVATVVLSRWHDDGAEPPAAENPLQLRAALQMAALFQVVWLVVEWARQRYGGTGLLLSALVSGVADVDALTASMALRASTDVSLAEAARAIVVGIAANTGLKLVIAITVGNPTFRMRVGAALLVVLAAVVGAVLW
jgi:uncharacterized membrane protein (DUF4010 family)